MRGQGAVMLLLFTTMLHTGALDALLALAVPPAKARAAGDALNEEDPKLNFPTRPPECFRLYSSVRRGTISSKPSPEQTRVPLSSTAPQGAVNSTP